MVEQHMSLQDSVACGLMFMASLVQKTINPFSIAGGKESCMRRLAPSHSAKETAL